MKCPFWYCLLALLFTHSLYAQSLAGTWQGVEDPGSAEHYCPSVLRLQSGKGAAVFGILYQESGIRPNATVNFQMAGIRAGATLKLNHGEKLSETGQIRNGFSFSYWCTGSITFTYNAALEKLTGHATYRIMGSCDTGVFVLYRVRLKSAATVPAGTLSALRVSGREVKWFADAELTQPLASGNLYRATLSQTTTFYITQGYYPSAEKVVTPVTILVAPAKAGAARPAPRPAPRPTPPAPKPAPLPAPADTLPQPAAPRPPTVLPTVLFKQGTPELLPTSAPALDKLAADLQANPALRLRIAGHTDRLGEPGKNQVLSEQRAAAVKAYLVKAGVPAGQLETIGHGDTQPLYSSPDIRNRRVTVERL